jgi:hypothetical protein
LKKRKEREVACKGRRGVKERRNRQLVAWNEGWWSVLATWWWKRDLYLSIYILGVTVS